jgi:hypothetical protein
MNDQEAFAIALDEAKLSYQEGGVPVNHPAIPNSLFISSQVLTDMRLGQLWYRKMANFSAVGTI